MAIRNILNLLGDVIGQLELPDGTSEEEWSEKLSAYLVPVLSDVDRIKNTLVKYRRTSSQLLNELYAINTLAGITVEQSDQMFDEYSDVVLRLREGAWPTALHRLSLKQPSGFVTQAIITSWTNKIHEYMS